MMDRTKLKALLATRGFMVSAIAAAIVLGTVALAAAAPHVVRAIAGSPAPAVVAPVADPAPAADTTPAVATDPTASTETSLTESDDQGENEQADEQDADGTEADEQDAPEVEQPDAAEADSPEADQHEVVAPAVRTGSSGDAGEQSSGD